MIKLSLISSATLLCVEAGVVTVVNTIQNRWFEINFQFCSRTLNTVSEVLPAILISDLRFDADASKKH